MGIKIQLLLLFSLFCGCSRNNVLAKSDALKFDAEPNYSSVKPSWLPKSEGRIGLSVYLIPLDQDLWRSNRSWFIRQENQGTLLKGCDIEVKIVWESGCITKYRTNGRIGFLSNDGIIATIVPVDRNIVSDGTISIRFLKFDQELRDKLGDVYFTLEYPSGK